MKKSPLLLGFYQALGLGAYISLVVAFMQNAENFLGDVPEAMVAATGLTLFVLSALMCGFIVFRQPFLLWTQKKNNQAVATVGYTALWLVILFLAIITASSFL